MDANPPTHNGQAFARLNTVKLFPMLAFMMILGFHAQANAQAKVSLHEKNATLETVLKDIRKQTGYLYALQDQWRQKAKLITVSIDNATLDEALSLCFKGQPFDYSIVNQTIVIKEKADEHPASNPVTQPAPVDTVHGVVTDDKKQPAAGVTVNVKGTSKLTITNDRGEFTIVAPEGSTLVFSSVNMETFEIKVSNESHILITLKTKTSQLGEVSVEVSNGYEKIPKERATGSFDFVDSATINQQVGSNALNRLNGVVPGVLFVSNQALQNGPRNGIMIRGLSTINGLKDPLVVVDNFPYDGDINNINPYDIESFTVLKDAAAASIWGVRAGNGVIVITTKKGKLNRPIQVRFNGGYIVTSKPNTRSLRTISSGDFIDFEQFLFAQGIYNVIDAADPQKHLFPSQPPVIEALLAAKKGAISQDSAQSLINSYRNIDTRDQFNRYMYQQATTQQYNVNISGGTNAASYYFSGGYDKNITNLGSPTERYTFRSDNTFKINSNFDINASIQYTQSNTTSGKPAYGSVNVNGVQVPYLQFADQNGNGLPVALTLRTPYTDTAGAGKLLDWKYYPLTDWQHTYGKNKQEDILGNISLSYRIFKGFAVSMNYMYESQHNSIDNFNDALSYYTRNMINSFTQVNYSAGTVKYVVPLGGILNHIDSKLETNNIRGQLSYSNQFGRNRIDAIAGGEIRQTRTFSNSGIYYGYNANTGAVVPVDVVNAYPNYTTGRLATITNIQNPYQEQLNRYVSTFGNAAYTYNDRYIISGSARKDGSNLFGVASNNQWNPLWSAGAAWIISRESFFTSDVFPYLKLRASYGYSGNTNPALAAVLTLSSYNYGYPTFFNASNVTNFPNPNLQWEQVKTFNAGIEFETRRHIVDGSVELYAKKGINLYGPAPVDPTDGLQNAQSITENIANMKSTGVDVNLNFHIIDKKFNWDLKLIYSYNQSKASKYNLDTTLTGINFINNGIKINPVVGEPLYSIVAFKWAGLDNQGNPQGYLDGKISEDYSSIINLTKKEDLIYKPSLPTHFGSISNAFQYKGVSLIVNVSYRLGYYFMKPTVSYGALISNGAQIGSSDYALRWQKPGDELKTSVPSFIYPDNTYRDEFYTTSSVNVLKADNIKLQFINLAYDLKPLTKNLSAIKTLQLYINASNLGILWKANHAGIDPDYFSNMPVPGKTYAIGIHSTF